MTLKDAQDNYNKASHALRCAKLTDRLTQQYADSKDKALKELSKAYEKERITGQLSPLAMRKVFETASLLPAQRIEWLETNDKNGDYECLTDTESIVLIVLILAELI